MTLAVSEKDKLSYFKAKKAYSGISKVNISTDFLDEVFLKSPHVASDFSKIERAMLSNDALNTVLKTNHRGIVTGIVKQFSHERMVDFFSHSDIKQLPMTLCEQAFINNPRITSLLPAGRISWKGYVRAVVGDVQNVRSLKNDQVIEASNLLAKSEFQHLFKELKKDALGLGVFTHLFEKDYISFGQISRRFRNDADFIKSYFYDHPKIIGELNKEYVTDEMRHYAADKLNDIRLFDDAILTQEVCTRLVDGDPKNALLVPKQFLTQRMIAQALAENHNNIREFDDEDLSTKTWVEFLTMNPNYFPRVKASRSDYFTLCETVLSQSPEFMDKVQLENNHLLKKNDRLDNWVKLLNAADFLDQWGRAHVEKYLLERAYKELQAARRVKSHQLIQVGQLIDAAKNKACHHQALYELYLDKMSIQPKRKSKEINLKP